ncbi:hypothetical protein Bpfe_024248, partial [Biomphalaria pfeifferi]
ALKLKCLYSQNEAGTERVTVLFHSNNEFFLSSVSLHFTDDSQRELIVKQFVKEKLSVDTNKDELYRFQLSEACEASCKLDAAMEGKWFGNRHPAVTITKDSFRGSRIKEKNCGSEACLKQSSLGNFKCIYYKDSNFIIRSENTIVRLVDYSIYSCSKFALISPNKVIFNFILKEIDPVSKGFAKVLLAKPTVASLEALCKISGDFMPNQFNILIKQDSFLKATEEFPKAFIKAFKYKMGDCFFVLKFLSTRMGFTRILAKNCDNEKPFYSAKGDFSCVYNPVDNGKNYFIMYNEDSSPNWVDTFRFVCVVYSADVNEINLTVTPQVCHEKDSSLVQYITGALIVQYITGALIGEEQVNLIIQDKEDAEQLFKYTFAATAASVVLIVCLVIFSMRKKKVHHVSGSDGDDISDHIIEQLYLAEIKLRKYSEGLGEEGEEDEDDDDDDDDDEDEDDDDESDDDDLVDESVTGNSFFKIYFYLEIKSVKYLFVSYEFKLYFYQTTVGFVLQ